MKKRSYSFNSKSREREREGERVKKRIKILTVLWLYPHSSSINKKLNEEAFYYNTIANKNGVHRGMPQAALVLYLSS